jgi:hypothetical protein
MQFKYYFTSITDNINRTMQSHWFFFTLRWKPSALREALQAWFTSFCHPSSLQDLFYLKRSNSISMMKMMLAYMLMQWKIWPIQSLSNNEDCCVVLQNGLR